MKNNHQTQKAFTLIELLVVIAIIALLSSVVLNNIASSRMKAADTKVAEDLRQVKIAAEMYYLDHKEYPPIPDPTAFESNDIKLAEIKNNKSIFNNKLAFFVKTAEAQSFNSSYNTPLCKNFDLMAQNMVSKKYLAQVPRHPYEDDSRGICYKAVKTTKTFVAYGALTQHVSVPGVTGGEANKRTGFIIGDISKSSLDEVVGYSQDNEEDNPYPMGEDGLAGYDENGNFDSVDEIAGITDGAPPIGGGGGGFALTSPTSTCPAGEKALPMDVPLVNYKKGDCVPVAQGHCFASWPYPQVVQFPSGGHACLYPKYEISCPSDQYRVGFDKCVYEGTYEQCRDGIDNDEDGLVDFNDNNDAPFSGSFCKGNTYSYCPGGAINWSAWQGYTPTFEDGFSIWTNPPSDPNSVLPYCYEGGIPLE